MSEDKVPVYRLSGKDAEEGNSLEALTRGATILFFLIVLCIFGAVFSGFLLGVFIRVLNYVLTFRF